MNKKTAFIGLLAIAIVAFIWSLTARRTKAEATTYITLPAGYSAEAYITGLSFPTAITWDEKGTMYVAEAGNANDPKKATPGRILQVGPGGATPIITGLNSATTDVKYKDGKFYVAHEGCLSVFQGNSRTDLIRNLPSGDHLTCEIGFDQDGWIYLGNGTATNSGIAENDRSKFRQDNTPLQWHDVPAKDIKLAGINFESSNPKTANPFDKVTTGAYLPFGTASKPGQEIKGKPEASGVILRVRPDGSDLQVYAWGFRNPFGMRFSPDGRLIAVDQGYKDSGTRPVVNSSQLIYEVKEDSWYGWPDYVGGTPITDAKYRSAKAKSPISFLIREHPPVSQPLAILSSNTVPMKFDFAPAIFDDNRRTYIATSATGELFSRTVGGVNAKQNGGQIIVLDRANGKQEVFAQNRSSLPAGKSLSGFNFPVDIKFGPDGSMYVVDFGVFDLSKQTATAVAKTGVIWKISKQRSEYQNFKSDCMSKLNCEQDDQWNPDYTALGQRLREFISTLGQEWGIYLKDLTSGKTLGVNEDLQVPAASTVKVPVVLYVSHLVTRGELSWNERLTYYSARDWRGGAGTLQYTAKDGDSFTIRELAEKAITVSDNVAWKMLEKRLGIGNIIAFMRQLGGTVVYPGGQNISTPRDNAIYMEAALEFSKVSPEGEKLMFDLANTIWNTGLNRNITEVTVAHKEGDVMGVADDVGVIYAYRPYILSIMSKGHDDVELGFEKIGQISRMVFDYQVSLFYE